MSELFGQAIHSYSHADAVRDGALVELPREVTTEAGIVWPVEMTRAAWLDAVRWGSEEQQAKPEAAQDEQGRMWDVLTMCRWALQAAGRQPATNRLPFQVARVPATGRKLTPSMCRLVVTQGWDDDAQPVLTIMRPDED